MKYLNDVGCSGCDIPQCVVCKSVKTCICCKSKETCATHDTGVYTLEIDKEGHPSYHMSMADAPEYAKESSL